MKNRSAVRCMLRHALLSKDADRLTCYVTWGRVLADEALFQKRIELSRAAGILPRVAFAVDAVDGLSKKELAELRERVTGVLQMPKAKS